jgi:putative membrane protein
MLTERWYVLAFLASFVVIASAERGWRRMLAWLATGTFIGWLMEVSSTRTGFPFGDYSYHDGLFPDELFIGGVPLFASLSFAFLTYFAYSVARTLLSPLERRAGDIVRVEDERLNDSLRLLMLAAVITVWVDLVIDPVTLLGRYWFLGDLYHYHSDGEHLGIPLTNYVGWLFTAALIVLVNQRIDVMLSASDVPARGFPLPMKPFWAVGTIIGNFCFMIIVTLYLLFNDDVPSSEPVGRILLSGLLLSAAFVAMASYVLGRKLGYFDRSRTTARGVAFPVRPHDSSLR